MMKKETKQQNSTDTQMGYDTVLYAVLKLSTTIKYDDPFSGEEVTSKLTGCAGYLPVFDNENDAKDAACDGKYEIVAIRPNLHGI